MGRNKEKYERKRGKKKRGSASASQGQAPPAHQSFHQQDFIPLQEKEAGKYNEDNGAEPEHTSTSASGNAASWMLDKRPTRDTETSAPFGLVEPDLKAYLRSAHVQLRELVANVLSEGRVLSNDGEIKALRNAMLDEIKGKELVLATDADTSLILEDMLCTFGERQTRILADALAKETRKVAIHRFGSHILQTTIAALQDCVSIEASTNSSGQVASKDGAVLRSATQMIVDMSSSLRHDIDGIIQQQFASHVLRSLLLVLGGQSVRENTLRSKKSKKFEASNRFSELVNAKAPLDPVTPALFAQELHQLLQAVKAQMTDESQIRQMCVDAIASPTLALVIELDASQEHSQGRKRLIYACLDGAPEAQAERSAHVETLLRDSVGSHLLERILRSADSALFSAFWTRYMQGRATKLGSHPTANFIVATLLKRANTTQLQEVCDDVAARGAAIVENRCLGVLTALAQRAQQLADPHEDSSARSEFWTSASIDCTAVRSVVKAFGFSAETSGEEDGYLIKAILGGKTRKDLKKVEKKSIGKKRDKPKYKSHKRKHGDGDGKGEGEKAALPPLLVKPSVQGSLLCQAIARLSPIAIQPLLSSLLNVEKLSAVATDASAVHVILVLLRSSRLTFQQRSKLSTAVLSHMTELLDDKFGSRVMDDVFDYSDAFFKAKIAGACVEAERKLLASSYGRFFLKRIQLSLYRRDIASWKVAVQQQSQDNRLRNENEASQQSKQSAVREPAVTSTAPSNDNPKKAKRQKIDHDLDAILATV